ncbi:MAG: glycosyltransferase family 2 protein, partial [Lachnoclostridium sp.]|nr:glycosyltransferase family 2 protein [Lachnoclostridium sp.]
MERISIVVSVYNEEKVLPVFYQEIKKVLDECQVDYEIIFVNDGSEDESITILKGLVKTDNRVEVLDFSRNFGHEAAMIAGIDYSDSDGVICMDADLQHPPECIPEILSRFREGYEIVSMVRTKNQDAGLIKRVTSKLFYKFLNAMSPVKFENNASDFFAISANVVEVLQQEYREKVRFLRGYVQSI